MNFRPAVLAGAAMLSLAMIAAAGDNNAKNIVGVWQHSTIDGTAKAMPGEFWEFTKDGKFKKLQKKTEVVAEGAYTVKDTTLERVSGRCSGPILVKSFGKRGANRYIHLKPALTMKFDGKEDVAIIKKLTATELQLDISKTFIGKLMDKKTQEFMRSK